MTKVELTGNLTRDVEIRKSENGTEYARLTVACDRGRDATKKTDFFPCTIFGNAIANANELKKGGLVRVAGYLRMSEYEGRQQIDIIARSVEPYSPTHEEVPA